MTPLSCTQSHEWTTEERRTMRVALAYWQSRLAQAPDLCMSPEGQEERDRIDRLLQRCCAES